MKKSLLFFLMIVFCLISNTVCPMDDREPDLSSYESIHLTEENKDRLQSFLKSQLVQQRELPENADLSLEAFVLDKGCRHQQLGQRYIVKVVAKWFSYDSVDSEPGIYVLRPKQHGCDICSYIFDSGLGVAGVNLPK